MSGPERECRRAATIPRREMTGRPPPPLGITTRREFGFAGASADTAAQ
jgi:hypothetical protein